MKHIHKIQYYCDENLDQLNLQNKLCCLVLIMSYQCMRVGYMSDHSGNCSWQN